MKDRDLGEIGLREDESGGIGNGIYLCSGYEDRELGE